MKVLMQSEQNEQKKLMQSEQRKLEKWGGKHFLSPGQMLPRHRPYQGTTFILAQESFLNEVTQIQPFCGGGGAGWVGWMAIL